MIDPISATVGSIASGSPTAVGLAFVAGVCTSVGPCVSPRYLAVSAIASGHSRPLVPTLAFISGLIGAFMLLGFGAGMLGSVAGLSTSLYLLLAAGLIAGGSATIVRAEPSRAPHPCCQTAHATAGPVTRRRSLGGIFLIGAASALVVSPCCTPIIASIVTLSTAIGRPLLGMMALGSFACGHALPLFFASRVTSFVRRYVSVRGGRQAPAIVSGSLMLALGAYYGLLA